ncbi:hypothetical protein [Roseibium sp. Sym1]|uniref:hypothetical protein n=1 Tax=Roseibium sp. Sym1 TaxID=3016006 RepID=UPI0022B5AE07|nr:hypothetical protein [Roseibium sp. Sym1]
MATQQCATCSGTGEVNTLTCPTCNGMGICQTCPTCDGSGQTNNATCATCGGSGQQTISMSPAAITDDDDVDIDPSDNSAFLFVPTANGSDTTPGALLRLGTYCEKEEAATDETNAKLFYPDQFVADEESGLATIYTLASGKDGNDVLGGILLACDGQALIKAGEKMYINCGDTLHVESGDEVTIKSGNSKDININAAEGNGKIVETSKSTTRKILGNEFTETTADSFTINHGDTVSITYGTKTFITLGSGQSVTVGGSFTGNLSGSVSLNVGLSFSADLTAAFSFTLFSASLTKWSLSKTITDLSSKDTTLEDSVAVLKKIVFDVASKQYDIKQSVADLERQSLQTVNNNFTLIQAKIDIRQNNTLVNFGNLAVFT